MVEVSVHDPKPISGSFFKKLETTTLRIEGGDGKGRVTLFFNRESIRALILAATEVEALFNEADDRDIRFNQ